MTTATKSPSVDVQTKSVATSPSRVVVQERPRYDLAKRAIDFVGATIALIILSPVFLISSLLVALSSPGPIFFRQKRVGKGGDLFTCLKFRTMVCNAEDLKRDLADCSHHDDPRTFKIRKDPRITRFGHWLRRSSADELPQLLNVLYGDMSLVGPRPPVPTEVSLYSDRDLKRLGVKPGLTCIWQVSGRADIPFEQQVSMDIEYIEKRSLIFDLKLLFLTVPALLSGRGAY